jgi:aryl-alcohol dehydrogenase-like predicted oxidoreductase
VQQRSIGDLQVSAIGLGGMPLSIKDRPDRDRALATVRAALDAGVTFIDTADCYSVEEADFGHNEELIAEAVQGRPDVVVATKGGHTRRGTTWTQDGSPAHLTQAAKESARRLGVDSIALYQFHRPDPDVPYAESLGALADLLQDGVIQRAGLSNVSVDQIKAAVTILGASLVSVQNQYSPAFLSSRAELDLCAELGIAFLPWSPLGGMSKAAGLGSDHAAFAAIASSRGVSPQQVALAWELAAAPVVLPIPGASRPETIIDSAKAVDLELTAEELATLP